MMGLLGADYHQARYEESGTIYGLTILQTSGVSAKANTAQGGSEAKSNNISGYTGLGSYLVREASPVPLPAGLLLLATARFGLGVIRRVRRK